jgi:hypothetical protein
MEVELTEELRTKRNLPHPNSRKCHALKREKDPLYLSQNGGNNLTLREVVITLINQPNYYLWLCVSSS